MSTTNTMFLLQLLQKTHKLYLKHICYIFTQKDTHTILFYIKKEHKILCITRGLR